MRSHTSCYGLAGPRACAGQFQVSGTPPRGRDQCSLPIVCHVRCISARYDGCEPLKYPSHGFPLPYSSVREIPVQISESLKSTRDRLTDLHPRSRIDFKFLGVDWGSKIWMETSCVTTHFRSIPSCEDYELRHRSGTLATHLGLSICSYQCFCVIHANT